MHACMHACMQQHRATHPYYMPAYLSEYDVLAIQPRGLQIPGNKQRQEVINGAEFKGVVLG